MQKLGISRLSRVWLLDIHWAFYGFDFSFPLFVSRLFSVYFTSFLVFLDSIQTIFPKHMRSEEKYAVDKSLLILQNLSYVSVTFHMCHQHKEMVFCDV